MKFIVTGKIAKIFTFTMCGVDRFQQIDRPHSSQEATQIEKKSK
jgi:hypothetical protein